MPTVVVRKEIVIRAPVEAAWGVLADVDGWSRWHRAIASSKLDGRLEAGATFRWKSGGMTIASRLEDVAPFRRLSWSGKAFGTRARHVWEFRPDGGSTAVATEESMDGWLPRLLRPWMRRTLERSLEDWLAALKRRCEA